MKLKFTVPVLLFGCLAIFSCSKDKNEPTDETQNQGDSLFVKMTQGILPDDDTVFLLSYDANHRVKSIINSSWEDTLEATYDVSGNLNTIVQKSEYGGETVNFSYNAANQLTAYNLKAGNYRVKYLFEYTNGVVSKKSFYSNDPFDGGEPTLFRYYTYEVTNGNISSMKEYADDDHLVGETKFTYNNEPNIFRSISLFNAGMNHLGAQEIANFETFFNKNLLTGIAVSGSQTTNYTGTYTYTYNDNKQLTKVIVSFGDDGTLTRQLSY